jgi:hypothetical protein
MAGGQVKKVLQYIHAVAAAPEAGDAADGALLDLFLARRDESAFEALVRRHGPMVLAVCLRVLKGAQDAEDAFQATFLVLARRAGSIGKRGSLASWLPDHGVALRTSRRRRPFGTGCVRTASNTGQCDGR